MSEWISVRDRLPDEGEMVLVYMPDWEYPVTVGERQVGELWATVRSVGTIDDVEYGDVPTHWMHLPESPVKPSLDAGVFQVVDPPIVRSEPFGWRNFTFVYGADDPTVPQGES